jgi:phosphoenolpyruvate carboxykinase (GTP)
MASEKTAAAAGTVGELRHDPMAMLPFCGYHMADYWQHWLDIGARGGAQMPAVFHVNWFRKDTAGRYLWPGFGENIRVLEWIAARCRGEGAAMETPIGLVPGRGALNLEGLELSRRAAESLLAIDRSEWWAEHAEQTTFLERFGERLPVGLRAEHEALGRRLG